MSSSGSASFVRRLLVTTCAATRTTGLAARFTGTAPFLPALFVLRYSNMGGLDPAVVATHLARCRTFGDRGWTTYWHRLAAEQLTVAESALGRVAGTDLSGRLVSAATSGEVVLPDVALGTLEDAAVLMADHGPQPTPDDVSRVVGTGRPEVLDAFTALDAWVKALTLEQVAAFPGHTPGRMRAYWRSRRLFDALVPVVTPRLGVDVRPVDVPVDGDVVRGYLVTPRDGGPRPVVLVTNGLEGTVQELLLPLLRYRESGLATFVMEMPGSYAYGQPMSPASEDVYGAVVDHLVRDPRVEGTRLGVVGVSFGGYWAARLAVAEPRLTCAVACGAPTNRTFLPGNAIGLPQVILEALKAVTGSRALLTMSHRLRTLSLRRRYRDVRVPLLVVNGDHDTLLSTQDSIDLAEQAPGASLLLYPDDDHCAMGHYRDWLDASQQWLVRHLAPPVDAPAPAGGD